MKKELFAELQKRNLQYAHEATRKAHEATREREAFELSKASRGINQLQNHLALWAKVTNDPRGGHWTYSSNGRCPHNPSYHISQCDACQGRLSPLQRRLRNTALRMIESGELSPDSPEARKYLS
jgi:hypothetical protein